jgi:uncharacterized protein (DUF302 family)
MRRHIAVAWFCAAMAIATLPSAGAQVGPPVVKVAPFDDVRFELSNAITTRGLAVHSEGNLGKMLDRTGADVGSTKPIYRAAEFIEVCSAKYARLMFEADPTLIGNCPFLFFIYERADRPGEVVVGFRRLQNSATPEGQKAVADTEAMLHGIVRDAVK